MSEFEKTEGLRSKLFAELIKKNQKIDELENQIQYYKNKEKKLLTQADLKEHEYAKVCYDKAIEELNKGNYEAAEDLFMLFENHQLYKYFKKE